MLRVLGKSVFLPGHADVSLRIMSDVQPLQLDSLTVQTRIAPSV